MKKVFIAVISAMLPALCFAASVTEPSATYLFDEKDGYSLYLDIYEPAPDSKTDIDGTAKPTVLFVFGGGFIKGTRDAEKQKEWYSLLNRNGYRVVAIDYRLGMKGYKGKGINKEFISVMKHSINIAVEDLFSATNYIIANKDELGIDPQSLVISGSSAGAITVLQGEWEICNHTEAASVLPEGFNYAGVIAFSGAIFNMMGKAVYAQEPCPTMLLHGTADKVVNYNQINIFKLYFGGSNSLAKAYRNAGFNYRVYRFKDNGHEIAGSECDNISEELDFIETNVMKGERKIVDAMVSDPGIKKWDMADFNCLYD